MLYTVEAAEHRDNRNLEAALTGIAETESVLGSFPDLQLCVCVFLSSLGADHHGGQVPLPLGQVQGGVRQCSQPQPVTTGRL